MRYASLRLAGIGMALLGLCIGAILGWGTPISLNPFVEPHMVGGIFFLAVFLVVTPLIGYCEMVFYWDCSRFEPALRRLRRSPQIGMGIIAPASFGLAVGLGMGWGLPAFG